MGFFSNLFKTKQKLRQEMLDELLVQKNTLIDQNTQKLIEKKHAQPVYSARNKLVNALSEFKQTRAHLKQKWAEAYANFSWWNKLKYHERLNLSELNLQIMELERALKDFDNTYGNDITELDDYFASLITRGNQRLDVIHADLVFAINHEKVTQVGTSALTAAWFAGLSIPVSAAGDIFAASGVYDALRSVNGQYADMSNVEIWWETLWMSPESYAGLASLTKGAYFEQLVAADTGGELFEHFNNPGTDITIDGVEMQIKATDSASYIGTVDQDIPVIATSEVAATTGNIDGGYTNEELTNSVDLALGGGVIDASDAVVDSILTGVGTLGLFATIRGINHASKQYENGGDGAEAIFAGAGVAIEGAAKGVVDVSEMLYNMAMSRPSRFVGRSLLAGIMKIDKKLTESGSKGNY